MNNPKVDNDLQKAIDDITKITNDDPIFADPVAGPQDTTSADLTGLQEIPDLENLDTSSNFSATPEQIAPATPAPKPEDIYPTPAPQEISAPVTRPQAANLVDPMAPRPNADILPQPNFDPLAENSIPLEEALKNTASAAAPTIAPAISAAPEPAMAPMPDFIPSPELTMPALPSEEAPAPQGPVEPFVDTPEDDLSTPEVKEAALRDLAPLLGKLDLPAERKFDICKNIIDNYHDISVLSTAYHSASGIADEKNRAEALLYLIDSIDKI